MRQGRPKGNRGYAVVSDGVDPQTGEERRRWHPAGTDRAEAERVADELATAAARRRSEQRIGLTLESFVDRWWLPAKKRQLRVTTVDGDRRNLRLHILPTLGQTVLRDLQPEDAEHLYEALLDGGRHDRAGVSPRRRSTRSICCYATSATTPSDAGC